MPAAENDRPAESFASANHYAGNVLAGQSHPSQPVAPFHLADSGESAKDWNKHFDSE